MDLTDKRVLVVDDEPSVLMSVSMMLESRGCKVYQADSGTAALNQLGEISGELDCIILDYTMPKLNGLQVLEKIRESGIETPVIMCSGLPLSKDENNCPAWPNEILSKPFQMNDLYRKINQVNNESSSNQSS